MNLLWCSSIITGDGIMADKLLDASQNRSDCLKFFSQYKIKHTEDKNTLLA